MWVISLILSLFFMAFLVPKKYIKYFFGISAAFLAILGSTYVPDQSQDLFRHYIFLEEIKNGGWSFLIKTHYFENTPIYAIYMYFISFFQKKELLPAITAFITYYLYFENLNIVQKVYYKKNKTAIAFSFLFGLSSISFLTVIGGIRNALAFSMCAYALYREFVLKRKKIISFSIYLIAIMMHTSVFIVIVVRIIIEVKNKKIMKILILSIASWPFFINQIIYFINNLPIGEFSDLITKMLKGYLEGGSKYVYSTAFIRLIVLCVMSLFFIIYINKKNYIENKLKLFLMIMLIINWTAIFQYDLFVRLININVFLSPIYMMPLISEIKVYKNNNLKTNKLSSLLVLLMSYSIGISLVFNTWSEYMKINFKFIN